MVAVANDDEYRDGRLRWSDFKPYFSNKTSKLLPETRCTKNALVITYRIPSKYDGIDHYMAL